MHFRPRGNQFGTHRVISPSGGLPQSAQKLDTSLPPWENEILVRVSALQIDSAGFHQLGVNGDVKKIIEQVRRIVSERGKMHNPQTDSGGVFLGRVGAVGPAHPLKGRLKEGDKVVSLVSLTLTPLELTEIRDIDLKKERIGVSGHAFVFESGFVFKMPDDLSEGVVLAALDVCGASAQVSRLAKKGSLVLVVGLGKAGRSAALQAGLNQAHVLGVDASPDAVDWCRKNLRGVFQICDASDPLSVFEWMKGETRGELANLVIHATPVVETEMSGILSCREGGTVLFFGMNTSFQKVVLGAEGIGKDVTLLMGNGYVPGHADLMLNLLRQNPKLKQWFEERYG